MLASQGADLLSLITEQYDTYPYPARDPADEKNRLLHGSPSFPTEIDHFLFGGQRDWSKPLRALVAGGGTGDALIQLAQTLSSAGKPYEITYLDLSKAAREIAEARAEVRALSGIKFKTGSLLDAPDLGRFDYIDCCGVLHHLPEPDAGFLALRQALAEGGGLGMMVYAPYGRSGVYPLQEGFNAVFGALAPKEKLAAARKVFDKLPDDHPFCRNRLLVDHNDNDAGFYDLLLHSQDRAYGVDDLIGALERAGLELVSFVHPALYDLSRLCAVPDDMDARSAMVVAEKLRGTMKVHVCYAAVAGSGKAPANGRKMTAVPHLTGISAGQLAQGIAKGAKPRLTIAGEKVALTLRRDTAPLIAGVNGRRSLAEIAQNAGIDPFRFAALWRTVEGELGGWGSLYYSGLLR